MDYMKPPLSSFLMHEGRTKEESSNHIGSGRYPVGSGDKPGSHPYQHTADAWYAAYGELRSNGYDDEAIMKYFGIKTKSELRDRVTLGKSAQRERIIGLYESGKTAKDISKENGIPLRTVYNIISASASDKPSKIKPQEVVDALKNEMATKKYLDVGDGTQYYIGCSKERLRASLRAIEEEGEYEVMEYRLTQVQNSSQQTPMTLLVPKGTTKAEVSKNLDSIAQVTDLATIDVLADETAKLTKTGIQYPSSISRNRVYVRYPSEGGDERDGTIELRRGVPDLDLGNDTYAQVRIAVDNQYYLKGVALYRDDIPKGYDIVFNTSKKDGTPWEKVVKELEVKKGPDKQPIMDENGNPVIDKDRPFSATIKQNGGQSTYIDENGEKKLSPINKVNSEGDWDSWSKSLAAQMTSKQPYKFIENQLQATVDDYKERYSEILKIENPTVRKYFLESFAGECDQAAVDLKTIAVPGQAQRLILPCPSLAKNEVYAPGYPDGTTLYLIRYPHQGVFEIPKLVVNNKNKEGLKDIGDARDAIGVNFDTATQLSGADFDGDTVTCVPESSNVHLVTRSPLPGLIGFDAKSEYPAYPGMTKVKDEKGWDKGREMGIITNLITDMSFLGASLMDANVMTNQEAAQFEDAMTRAVKYAQVIIDAEKHNLDYHRAYEDLRIAELHKEWQGKAAGGAKTIVSRSKSPADIPEHKPIDPRLDWDNETGEVTRRPTNRMKKIFVGIDPETNKKIYEDTDEPKTVKVTKMEAHKDARELMSDPIAYNPKELLYANFANTMKAMANEVRKTYLATKDYTMDREAKKEYSEEVESIMQQYMEATKNAPRERQAQITATVALRALTTDYPELKSYDRKEEYSKIKAQYMAGARVATNSKRYSIKFTAAEWEAIEHKAIPSSTLSRILDKTDSTNLRKLAMPRSTAVITPAKRAAIESYRKQGMTVLDIADKLGLSQAAVKDVLYKE